MATTTRPGPDAAVTGEEAPGPRRPVRRPPVEIPWDRIQTWVGLLVVAACSAFVFVELRPDLLFRNTTPTGGDTAAHVWWPAYLRDHLLPWRLTGWSPAFYAGFPAGQFYFPVPALLIVAIDVVAPYNVAFKLVTALGPVLLPVGAYVLGRGLRAPRPMPAAFAVAATAFLFFNGDPGSSSESQSIAFNQHIMGGTLASNLAGEFSFTLALAFALAFLGALAAALRTGRRQWLPAVLLAATVMSHLVVAILAAIGALVVWLASRPVRSLLRTVAIGAVGLLLSAVWLLPLIASLGATTDMRYRAIRDYTDYLFPSYVFGFDGVAPWRWGGYVLIACALTGLVVELVRWFRDADSGTFRRTVTVVLVAVAAVCGLAFRFWEDVQSTTVWNLRLLPFWYVAVFLLMAVGAAEVIRAAGWTARRVTTWWVLEGWTPEPDPEPDPELDPELDDAPAPGAAPEAAWDEAYDDEYDDEYGDGGEWDDGPSATDARGRALGYGRIARILLVGLLTLGATVGSLIAIDGSKAFLPSWIAWNYRGYEDVTGETGRANPKSSAEYRAFIDSVAALPAGRLLWEGNQQLDVYGSPLALMLLPYWTDGRITSMEGVYFEASATTPYHFMAVSTLAGPGNASNAVGGVPYGTFQEFSSRGVPYLQLLGVRYLAVHSSEAKQAASSDPRLRLVATVPDLDVKAPSGWSIFVVRDSAVVSPLRYEPVVVDPLDDADRRRCREQVERNGVPSEELHLHEWPDCLAVPWFADVDATDRPLVQDGPSKWARVDVTSARTAPRTELPAVRVTRIRTTEQSVSFRVSRTGVPVYVKTSWFPNWEVDGAEGPYRATPNFMVVVPTDRDVELRFATTTAEWLGRLGTLGGLAGVVALAVLPGRRRRAQRSSVDGGADAID